ncbi:MAG: DUF2922 domain-containing protein [Caldisericia bacterium]|nr:DUF2922 domain-containing protein [Caldisericia bacterium]
MNKQVYIVFATETEGRTFTMRFSNPKNNLTQQNIQNFANWVINQNIFLTRYGELTSLVDAGIVETTRTDLVP